jgi:hypothetical protein
LFLFFYLLLFLIGFHVFFLSTTGETTLLSFVKACSFHAHKVALTAASHAVDKTRAATVQKLCAAGVPKDKAITEAREQYPREPVQNATHGNITTLNRSALQRAKQLLRMVINVNTVPDGCWSWEGRFHDSIDHVKLVFGYTFRPGDGVLHEVLRAGDQILRVDGKSMLEMSRHPTPAIVSAIGDAKINKRVQLKIFRPNATERKNQVMFAEAVDTQSGLLHSCLFVVVVLI